MNLITRLVALEQRRPRQVQGYRIQRVRPDGEVVAEVIAVGTELFADDAAFATRYPTGQITRGLIVVDDGGEPAPRSLMAQWFPPEGYR